MGPTQLTLGTEASSHTRRDLLVAAIWWPTSQPTAQCTKQTGINKGPSRSDSQCSPPAARLPAIWFPVLWKLVAFLDIFLPGLISLQPRVPNIPEHFLLPPPTDPKQCFSEQKGCSVRPRSEGLNMPAANGATFAPAQPRCLQNQPSKEAWLPNGGLGSRSRFTAS